MKCLYKYMKLLIIIPLFIFVFSCSTGLQGDGNLGELLEDWFLNCNGIQVDQAPTDLTGCTIVSDGQTYDAEDVTFYWEGEPVDQIENYSCNSGTLEARVPIDASISAKARSEIVNGERVLARKENVRLISRQRRRATEKISERISYERTSKRSVDRSNVCEECVASVYLSTEEPSANIGIPYAKQARQQERSNRYSTREASPKYPIMKSYFKDEDGNITEGNEELIADNDVNFVDVQVVEVVDNERVKIMVTADDVSGLTGNTKAYIVEKYIGGGPVTISSDDDAGDIEDAAGAAAMKVDSDGIFRFLRYKESVRGRGFPTEYALYLCGGNYETVPAEGRKPERQAFVSDCTIIYDEGEVTDLSLELDEDNGLTLIMFIAIDKANMASLYISASPGYEPVKLASGVAEYDYFYKEGKLYIAWTENPEYYPAPQHIHLSVVTNPASAPVIVDLQLDNFTNQYQRTASPTIFVTSLDNAIVGFINYHKNILSGSRDRETIYENAPLGETGFFVYEIVKPGNSDAVVTQLHNWCPECDEEAGWASGSPGSISCDIGFSDVGYCEHTNYDLSKGFTKLY